MSSRTFLVLKIKRGSAETEEPVDSKRAKITDPSVIMTKFLDSKLQSCAQYLSDLDKKNDNFSFPGSVSEFMNACDSQEDGLIKHAEFIDIVCAASIHDKQRASEIQKLLDANAALAAKVAEYETRAKEQSDKLNHEGSAAQTQLKGQLDEYEKRLKLISAEKEAVLEELEKTKKNILNVNNHYSSSSSGNKQIDSIVTKMAQSINKVDDTSTIQAIASAADRKSPLSHEDMTGVQKVANWREYARNRA